MIRIVSIVGLLVLLLAACGAPQTTTEPIAPSAESSAPAAAPAATQFPLTVTHATGSVTLEAPAKRIVACGEEALDFLIALAIQPVGYCSDRVSGATEGEAYTGQNFFPADKLGQPVFVGAGATPSIERIATLKPDLILVLDYTEGLEQLAQAAPTYVLSVDADGYWRTTLNDIAALTDSAAAAEAFLADYDAKVAKLAADAKPLAAAKPNVALVYSFGAADGTMLLANDWHGSTPFTQLGFTVVEPADIEFTNGVAPISPETVATLEADIIVVLRPRLADGSEPTYPVDELLALRDDVEVVYQVFDSTRASTAPWTDRFVLEEVAALFAPLAADAPAGASEASAAFPQTIVHERGEATLETQPKRIVALEWTYVEDLLALGIQPVGVADIAGFQDWVRVPVALDPAVVDVGLRGEPSIEKIAALNPDLIIGLYSTTEANFAELNAIAPTLVFNPYPSDQSLSQYDEMRQTLGTIARATGRESEAAAALERMEATFAEVRASLAEAGLAGQPFVLSQAWTGASAASVRLFTENAMATEIIKQLGLEPAWSDPVFQEYGFSSVGVEALAQLSAETHYFYVVQADDNPFESAAVKPLWDQLPFVKAGNAHALGGDTWLFGGPLSAELLATKINDLLLAKDQ